MSNNKIHTIDDYKEDKKQDYAKYRQCEDEQEYGDDRMRTFANGTSHTLTVTKKVPAENFDTGDTSPTLTVTENVPVENFDTEDCVSTAASIQVVDLLTNHVNILAGLLDSSYSVTRNWRHLAEEVLDGINGKSKILDDLELCYAGGGSPGEQFMVKLKTIETKLTIERFIKIMEKIKRFDVKQYIEDHVDTNLKSAVIWSFANDHIWKIGSMLNYDDGWRLCADEFKDFDRTMKDAIKLSIKRENMYSPTKVLFQDVIPKYKRDMSLSDLRKICTDLDMHGVAKELEKIEAEISEK